jgi:peptide chain release factor 1
VTDHRIGLTIHQLEQTMDGKLQPFVDALTTHYNQQKLNENGSGASA